MTEPRNRASVDLGLLILRVGIGATFIVHGWGKLIGGPDVWAKLGGAVTGHGLPLPATFWGFMAMVAEFGGGIALILGVFMRVFSALLFITMAVAVSTKSGFSNYAYPLSMAVVALSLFFIGPGRFNAQQPLRNWLQKRKARRKAKKQADKAVKQRQNDADRS